MMSEMRLPAVSQAEDILNQAQLSNSGKWVSHCKIAAECAEAIARQTNSLNGEAAYVMGLLHDIGRKDGVVDMLHIIRGYEYMHSLNYDSVARICLTHSFPDKNILSYNGVNDCSGSQTEFIRSYIENVEYSDYDRLIQLCDALALPEGATFIEKRLVEVALRRGVNSYTLEKWKAFLELKDYFEKMTNKSIYNIIGVSVF